MNFNQPQGLENNKIEEIKTPENKVKEGVGFVFEQNPELAQIGTKEQYSEYLKTIFPESKIKDIIYHGGKKDIKEFDVDRSNVKPTTGLKKEAVGSYFIDDFKIAKSYARQTQMSLSNGFLYFKSILGDRSLVSVYCVLLNFKNPYIINSNFQNRKNELKINSGIISKEERERLFNLGYDSIVRKEEFVAFNQEQIHILGSQKDIENFKNFVNQNK